MNVTNRLDVELEPEEYERFQAGEPLQIPTGNQLLVLYPPDDSDENTDAEEVPA